MSFSRRGEGWILCLTVFPAARPSVFAAGKGEKGVGVDFGKAKEVEDVIELGLRVDFKVADLVTSVAVVEDRVRDPLLLLVELEL